MVESAKDQMKTPYLAITKSAHYHKLIVSGLNGVHILLAQKAVVVVGQKREYGTRWFKNLMEEPVMDQMKILLFATNKSVLDNLVTF